jgi:integrase
MAVFRPTYQDRKTGERRQSTIWWYEFTFAGRRIRESAKTTRKTLAVEAEKRRRAELERAIVGLPAKPERRIERIAELLDAYLQRYRVNHRPDSIAIVRERSAPLKRLLGSLLPADLGEARLVEYIARRQSEGASGRTVNMEIAVLARALGGTWKALWPRLKKLDENSDVGRALQPDEERRLLEAAARNKSPLIYPYLVLLVWTGVRESEGRLLQWRQIDFEKGLILVGASKTEAGRGRAIPMSGPLRQALELHAARYAAWFGPPAPDWYVFPRSNRQKPADPTQPVGSLKVSWDTVRREAGVRCRLHDLRHTFCTKLGEAGIAESTMLDMMGHVSAAMLKRYSHIRLEARRRAIEALERAAGGVLVPKEVPKVSVSKASGASRKLLQ